MHFQAPMTTSSATTAEYIEHHALATPERLALVFTRAQCTYRRLYADLRRLLQAMQALGVQPGDLVAVCHADLYLQLLLLLACEAAGAATMPFQASDAQPEDFEGFALVLTDSPLAAPPAGVRVQPVTRLDLQPWLLLPESGLPALTPVQRRDDDPVRVARTSGSTGLPKRMLITRGQQQVWITAAITATGHGEHAVELVTLPLAVNAVWTRVLVCLHQAVTVAFGDLPTLLRSQTITACFCLPIVLADLVAKSRGVAHPPLIDTVIVGGGQLAPTLVEQALSTFCHRLMNIYGANEVGPVTRDLDADSTGWLWAGVEVQLLDEQQQPVPLGESGTLWVRGSANVGGYWGNADNLVDRFVNGWFQTGDSARWYAPRQLQLLGRDDDVLDIGGLKKSPYPLEATLLALAGVDAAAVTTRSLPDGSVQPVAALVLQPGQALTSVLQALRPHLPGWAQAMVGVQVNAMPRTPGGKLDRHALKALVSTL
jgi:arthrofactin-type cyclic lipopeptide synthetase A